MPRDKRLYMTFPIDFWTHPKVSRLSDAAFRAFVESNGHSRMIESDGVIEAEDAEFMWKPDVLDELTRSHPTRPLMLRDEGTYRLRDYAEHQFTKADRDGLSEKRREAGKRGAAKRWAEMASATQMVADAKQEDGKPWLEKGIGINPSSTKKGGTANRGTRIPEPFILTADMRTAMADECPGLDIDKSTKQFVDYWRAASGRTATKKDWVAAWRFWLRRDADSKKPNRLTPTERAAQTAAAGRQVMGQQITSLEIEQ